MGMFWGPSSSPNPPTADDKPAAPTSTPTTTDMANSAPNEPNVGDAEIQKFLDLVTSDAKPEPKAKSFTPASSSSWLATKMASLKPSPPESDLPNAAPHDALSETLLPTGMSCRQAFDLAWSCNSIGGQWNAVYRHGEMRSCSESWDDFWFCMRQKSYSGETKASSVRQYYRNKEYNKYYAPGKHNSEEVWEARTSRLPVGTAFSQSLEAPKVDDDEWRRQESDRRKGIREGLGYSNDNTPGSKSPISP